LLASNPYLFLGRRPFREAHLRGYIVAQHRAGRPLSSIVDDPYVRRLGSESFFWNVVQDPRTIAALDRDVRAAIERCEIQVRNAKPISRTQIVDQPAPWPK
jgi:hypothetical protein